MDYSLSEDIQNLRIVIVAAGANSTALGSKFVLHGGINLFTKGEESRQPQPYSLMMLDSNVRTLGNLADKTLWELFVAVEIRKRAFSFIQDYKVARGCRDLDNSKLYWSDPLHIGRNLAVLDF